MKLIGRGQIKPPADNAHPFIKFIANNNPITYRELAKKSGVTASTMQRWRYHASSPMLMDLEAVLNAMGYKLTITRIEE